MPWLYPKGICGGDFSEVLTALLGPDAPGLAASTITRPKTVWWDEYEAWSRRDLVEAEKAFDFFVAAHGAKYDKAVERLTKAANDC